MTTIDSPPVLQYGAIADAAAPRPMRTFCAMFARDLYLLRKNIPGFVVQTCMQPMLFSLVFLYVLPSVSSLAGGAPGKFISSSFSSIIVPGMVANAIVMNSMTVVTMRLVRELGHGRAIEDRILAPFPVYLLGIQKICWGALNGLLAGMIVFPVTYFLHAPGMAPHINVGDWPLFVCCLVLIPLLAASIGLLLGTVMNVHKINMLINLIMVPATMLGCVYFPWAALSTIPWLQILVLIDPVVYGSEALRVVFTPSIPHMPTFVVLTVLVLGLVVIGWCGLRTFTRRLIG